jgi:hypothetical protein
MTEKLSIKAADEEIEIRTNKADIAAMLISGIVGGAPYIGPLVGELITSRIPNQKMARVIRQVELLDQKLRYLREDVLKENFRTVEFEDLVEDALTQAARALSPERQEYIANLLKSSLTDEQLDHLGKKKLLALLNELNDAEIILLYYYSVDTEAEKETMRARYPFLPRRTTSQDNRWRSNDPNEQLYDEYKAHITRFLHLPGTDYKTTNLANTLLRYIGLRTEGDRGPDNSS